MGWNGRDQGEDWSMAATSVEFFFDNYLICSQSYPVHVLFSGGSRVQVHLVTLIQLTLRRGKSGNVGLRHWKFSGEKFFFFLVFPIWLPIFLFFLFLNEPGSDVTGIDPGMALTPFPCSIWKRQYSNPRPFNREHSSLTTTPSSHSLSILFLHLWILLSSGSSNDVGSLRARKRNQPSLGLACSSMLLIILESVDFWFDNFKSLKLSCNIPLTFVSTPL